MENSPQILVTHITFKQDMQDAFSMMAFVCGMDEDKFVYEFQLGQGFQPWKQHSLFWYDFTEVIVQQNDEPNQGI